MEIIKSHCENNSLEWSSNAIAITMKDSKLYKKATSEDWLKIFNLQDWVGGRTSITSSVGLLPLALINENISEFIRGASLMDESTRIVILKIIQQHYYHLHGILLGMVLEREIWSYYLIEIGYRYLVNISSN